MDPQTEEQNRFLTVHNSACACVSELPQKQSPSPIQQREGTHQGDFSWDPINGNV